MLLQIDNISFNVTYNEATIQHKIPIIFLHGFTGNQSDWKFLNDRLPKNFSSIFIDLIGHGKTSSPVNKQYYSQENQVNYLLKIVNHLKLESFVLVGYSMGGRLAASFAIEHYRLLSGLVLESASFGIKNDTEKENRKFEDEKLAEKISKIEISEFIDYWYSIPLFNSLKDIPMDKFDLLKSERVNTNNKVGLANSLLGFSTGKMGYLLPKLKNINLPVLLIAGEKDVKYVKISNTLNQELKNSCLRIVKNCGHNVHFEKPEEFLKFLYGFLLNIRVAK